MNNAGIPEQKAHVLLSPPLQGLSAGARLLLLVFYVHAAEALPPQSLDLGVEPQQRLSQLQVLRSHLQLQDNDAKNPIRSESVHRDVPLGQLTSSDLSQVIAPSI
ncbi:hypothetical protein EYF80_047627 [Liparis tanakae]|uniref:Uncharacterized protein n=1 Tax=Liparis tanakae TaxID=230148 RepID=A0A4Z2FMF7_9TELE|nr:hypothetical protein EYF80_047627 [Liparis tanakae]